MMSHLPRLFALTLAIALAACAPVETSPSTAGETTPAAGATLDNAVTPWVSTAISGSGSGAGVAGTVEPLIVTLQPPGGAPLPTPASPTWTPMSSIAGGLNLTELKYRLLAQYPDLFFCDPDYYPVARMDELELAQLHFPEIQANAEEYDTILAHNQLTGQSSISSEQKLLIYQEHKKLAAIQLTQAASGYQFQLQSAKAEGTGELITGLIDDLGVITVQKIQPTIVTCPICLAAGMRIDTPAGAIPVENLRMGMQVWTLDQNGLRIVVDIVRLSKTVVPADHLVVHLVLDDGRDLWVSPGHPIGDGRFVGQLQAGDLLDGAWVLSVESIPYQGYATYDLLPGSETGFYWANGILIASALKQP